MSRRQNVYKPDTRGAIPSQSTPIGGIPAPIRTGGDIQRWGSATGDEENLTGQTEQRRDGIDYRERLQALQNQYVGGERNPDGPVALVSSQPMRMVKALQTSDDYDPTRPSYAQPIKPAAVAKERESEIPMVRSEVLGDSTRLYPDAFKEIAPGRPFLQPPQDNLILNPVPIYISIDSRDRDRSLWPQPNQFRVPFVSSSDNPAIKTTGDRIRNIYSITLLSCVVPNSADVFDQPYLLLQLDEIEGIYEAANPTTTKAITKLYFREANSGSTFLRLDKGVGDPTCRVYWPAPKASLSQLTVSFRNYDGTLFNFGTDTTPPTDPNTELQTTLTLEIRTYIVDTLDTIGHRNPN